jgi:DNA mismatch repair ATPase MutL
MRSRILMASAALLVGTVFAFAQGGPERKEAPGASQSQSKQGIPGAQKEQQKAPATSGQTQRNEENRTQNRTQGQNEKSNPGQVQREENKNRTQGQSQQPNRTQGQNQREPAQTGEPGQTQREPNQTQTQRQGGGSVTLSTEQRTKIRQTVLEGKDAPKVGRVDFAVNVGTAVPRTVRVVEVPPTLVEIHPEWRGYRYFVYEDEIVIVDPRTLMIVAIVNV